MKNKTKYISIRLNTEEYTKLSNISNLNHLSNSEYIRSLINRINPVENHHSAEIASVLSRLYIKLGELGIGDEAIAKEVEALCRMLSL